MRRPRREEVRRRLLDAGASVFAERGLEGASVEEIAETAGFSRGALYSNFQDKYELFLALAKRRAELSLLGDEAVAHRAILGQYRVALVDTRK